MMWSVTIKEQVAQQLLDLACIEAVEFCSVALATQFAE